MFFDISGANFNFLQSPPDNRYQVAPPLRPVMENSPEGLYNFARQVQVSMSYYLFLYQANNIPGAISDHSNNVSPEELAQPQSISSKPRTYLPQLQSIPLPMFFNISNANFNFLQFQPFEFPPKTRTDSRTKKSLPG